MNCIAQKLIGRDPQTTEEFYREGCARMFSYIIKHLYPNGSNMEREEMINDFYCYLMEENAAVLRRFRGESKLTTFIRQVAYNYFRRKKDNERKRRIVEDKYVEQETFDRLCKEMKKTAKDEVNKTLEKMSDKRSSYLIRRLYLDEYPASSVAQELDVPITTFYVLKQRALIKI